MGWSLAGCGGSSQTTDGGSGGKRDGGTDVAGATGGRAGTGGTAGGTAGTGGTAGAGGATVANIGNSCAADADCGSGLTCLTAAGKSIIAAEGPANGYCSEMCTTDADCGGVGICLNVSAEGAPEIGYCFQSCTFGSTATDKCHSRNDVGCLTIDDTTTPTTDVCFPVCSQDSDCPTGRHCDVGNSLCSDTAPPGDPLGTHCVANPDSGASNCAGGCLPIGSGTGTATVANFCSMLCVLGNLDACNWTSATQSLTSGGVHGVCALASSTAQVGDVGFCSQECNVAADCSDQTDAAGLTCDTTLMSTTGHGICSWG